MSQNRSQKLPKSLHLRILELTQSLQIIRDSLELIKGGKQHQILPLYGQLRSLLTEKSKQNPSLLFDLSEILSFPLELFYIPILPLPDNISKSYFHFASPEISNNKQHRDQKKISLKDFLNVQIITLDAISYTTHDLIHSLANMAGGAHYPSNIPKDYAELFTLGLYGNNMLQKLGIMTPGFINTVITQIGSVVYKLGVELLREISEVEIYMQLYFPRQKLDNEAFIIDLNYPDSLMKLSLSCNKYLFLEFHVYDSQGLYIKTTSSQRIRFNRLNLIVISYGFTDQLKTFIELSLNNKKVIDKKLERVLAFRNDLIFYNKYFNRSFEDENKGMTFGMAEYILRKRLCNPSDKGEIISYLKSKQIRIKESKLVWFSRGNYGFEGSNQKGMKMHGSVMHQTINEYTGQPKGCLNKLIPH